MQQSQAFPSFGMYTANGIEPCASNAMAFPCEYTFRVDQKGNITGIRFDKHGGNAYNINITKHSSFNRTVEWNYNWENNTTYHTVYKGTYNKEGTILKGTWSCVNYATNPDYYGTFQLTVARNTDHDNEFKEKQQKPIQTQTHATTKNTTTKKTNTSNNEWLANFGALGELLQIIDSHMLFMNQQETNVDEFITNSSSADLLRTAKEKALETERELMEQIMNVSEINSFLNNIILIENLFNSFYTSDVKKKQEFARQKYASNIEKYESKPKPQCNIGSFVELMFAGTNLHISSFKKWLKKLTDKCKENEIIISQTSGAKGKNIERAFYKSFYVYAVTHSHNGFKQMTDVLRCSLVFDNFDDLYRCFGLIEELSVDNGGILRCKDRFNPNKMPFGYRDLLINMYCPGSKIVAEIQLHHTMFYKRKKISHAIYKKARLFEEGHENMAYKYADQHFRKIVGNKIYEIEEKEDEKSDFEEEEEDEQVIFEEHICEMSAEKLFEKWKLTKYTESFINDEGYDDPSLWKDITLDELRTECGFKGGHAKKFISYVQEMEKKRNEFEEIKKKRAKFVKNKQNTKKKIAQQIEGDVMTVEGDVSDTINTVQ